MARCWARGWAQDYVGVWVGCGYSCLHRAAKRGCSSIVGRLLDAGAEVVKLFDSWAGSLKGADFAAYALEPAREIIAGASIHDGPKVAEAATGQGTVRCSRAMCTRRTARSRLPDMLIIEKNLYSFVVVVRRCERELASVPPDAVEVRDVHSCG